MPEFVDVRVIATGEEIIVPADWVNDPVLGKNIELIPVANAVVDPATVPSEHATHAVVDAFAEEHGIDLSDATTVKEKVAVINEAVAAVQPAVVELPPTNPEVQTVAGQASTESPYPVIAQQRSDETPANGDEEN